MYSTYQQYQQRGGKLPESEYQANAQKASELIDYYTMGQAASAETMGPQLSACECDLADIIPTLQGAASGIQSENVDGYSVTYTDMSVLRKEAAMAKQEALDRYLPPTNPLRYAGGDR